MKTNFMEFFPDRFLPPPIPVAPTAKGLEVTRSSKGRFRSLFQSLHIQEALSMKHMVYDQFYPSLQKRSSKTGITVLERRICPYCNLYHSTMKMMAAHRTTCAANPRVINKNKPAPPPKKRRVAKTPGTKKTPTTKKIPAPKKTATTRKTPVTKKTTTNKKTTANKKTTTKKTTKKK